jgi:GNAT superfamily N-acetyltransferase
MNSPLIRPYTPSDQSAFAAHNRRWLEEFFRVEPEDEKVLGDPDAYILSKGGEIWMAECDGVAVGCCALLAHEDGSLELAKMAVDPAHHGKKIGKLLAEKIIERAKHRNPPAFFIISNTKLKTAISLYRKVGFVNSKTPRHERFERGNITLEMMIS